MALLGVGGVWDVPLLARVQRIGPSGWEPRYSPPQVLSGPRLGGIRCSGYGCGCGEAVSRSLGLHWMGLEHRMCLQGLGSRDQGPTSMNPDTHLPGAVKVQGSSGQRCSRGWLQVCGGCSQVSGTLVGGGRGGTPEMPLRARG